MKVNSLSIQQQEEKFKQDLEYEEWLRDNSLEPTIDDINNMERVFCKSTIFRKPLHYPINTLNYQPLPQGA